MFATHRLLSKKKKKPESTAVECEALDGIGLSILGNSKRYLEPDG
jgi:hypothetical protein